MKKYIKTNFGFSPEFKNIKTKFKEFSENGLPVYEIIYDENSEVRMSLVSNPASKIHAVIEVDEKDMECEISTDVTNFLIKPKKHSFIYKWWYKKTHQKENLVPNLQLHEVTEIGRFYGCSAHIQNREYYKDKNCIPHLHIKISNVVNIRVSISGKYISTVKGFKGENKQTKKFIKNHLKPFLKRNIGDKTGEKILLDLWKEYNPHLNAPLT